MCVELFGYNISNRGVAGDVALALDCINSGRHARYMACANPHSLVQASRDRVFHHALRGATLLVPDGSGIVLAARILGVPLAEKVAGYDFFCGLSKLADKRGKIKYFFLGSSDKVLSLIVSRMHREFSSIDICGTFSPPFKTAFSPRDNEEMIKAVNSARPDVLWVGMTAPKQEKWIYENRLELEVPFIGAIGAVFDFYAGTRKRSSYIWIRTGLEWLPRFLKEPARLWERNMKSTPIFLCWIIKEKLKRMKRG